MKTRNRQILEDVLSGKEFKQVAAEHGIHAVVARSAFHREFKNTAPALYEVGRGSGATPSIGWCRDNKDAILQAKQILFVDGTSWQEASKIRRAIRMLEEMGYEVIPPEWLESDAGSPR